MTSTERIERAARAIEAAARAICEADPLSPAPDAPIVWNGKSARAWEPRAAILRQAVEEGLFCHPARVWLAPMEATEGMAKHAEGLTDFAYSAVVATPEDVIREWQSGYRLMRDAYLKAQG